MKPPLNSKELIELLDAHRNNIGKMKCTYQGSVLFGYMIKTKIPCIITTKYNERDGREKRYSGCGAYLSSVGTYCPNCGHKLVYKQNNKV